jgi:hypothetical protein
MALRDRDHCAGTKSGIDHSCCGASDIGGARQAGLQEYLVLASVFETCEFNNVNILKFLLSKETTLEGLLKLARRRAKTSREVAMNNDSDQNHTAFGLSDA